MMLFLTNQSAKTLEQLLNKVQTYSVSTLELIVGLILSFIIGVFIFIVYKYSFQGTVYSYTFNFSLILLPLITTIIILTISSNLILSLGMVGALSIVRFRAAMKDPIDIVYIFWSITAGLAVGATQYILAIFGSVFIGLVIFIFTTFKLSIRSQLLIVNYSFDADKNVQTALHNIKYKFKSKNIENNNNVELTIEIYKNADKIVEKLKNIKEVTNVSVLAFEE